MKKWIRNKYVIATALFVLMLIFSDRNSVIDQYRYRKQYQQAREEYEYYNRQVKDTRKAYDELFSDTRMLEKFAREKYLMKRDNEDIFVIVDKSREKGN